MGMGSIDQYLMMAYLFVDILTCLKLVGLKINSKGTTYEVLRDISYVRYTQKVRNRY